MDIREIPLDQLYFGHEANPPINVRKVGREADIEPLAATIAAKRLGQPLNVRQVDGKVYVADGNRRLAALRLNAGKGLIPADWPTPCDFDPVDDELSVALNIERVAMHPADEYVKFQEMHAGGRSVDEIAHRFGLEPVRVRRRLALGSLSPLILDAWRNEELGDHADETVRALTMAPTIAEQERVFKKLSKSRQLWSNAVRHELGMGGSRDTANMFKVVGPAAYQKAGGAVVEDLFGENHHIADPALVRRLWDEKVAAKVAELKEAGWSWVEMSSALPGSWEYSWPKLPINKKKATAEDKAKAGCVVSITHQQEINVTYGVMRPKPAKVEKSKVEKSAPATISNAMMERLSIQLTTAAKDAMLANPKTALAAVVAGMMVGMHHSPVKLVAGGIFPRERSEEAFADVLSRLSSMSTEDLLVALAREASLTLDMKVHHNSQLPLGIPNNVALVDALEPEAMQTALVKCFDAEDYFKTVPRSFTVAAIREAINDEEARKADKLGKTDLGKFALANLPKTGWLPSQLRTATYAGPGVAKPKAARRKAA